MAHRLVRRAPGGTRDNPDCRTLAISFHTYDRSTRARLDAHFGLAKVGRGYDPFYPFDGLGPILSCLGDYLYLGSSTTLVCSREMKLPDRAFPPW